MKFSCRRFNYFPGCFKLFGLQYVQHWAKAWLSATTSTTFRCETWGIRWQTVSRRWKNCWLVVCHIRAIALVWVNCRISTKCSDLNSEMSLTFHLTTICINDDHIPIIHCCHIINVDHTFNHMTKLVILCSRTLFDH